MNDKQLLTKLVQGHVSTPGPMKDSKGVLVDIDGDMRVIAISDDLHDQLNNNECDDWIENDGSLIIPTGKYWVMSNLGVRIATYSITGHRFKDDVTQKSDSSWYFTVSHYMPITKPKPPVEFT